MTEAPYPEGPLASRKAPDRLLSEDREPIKLVSSDRRDVWFKQRDRRCFHEDGRGRCTSRRTYHYFDPATRTPAFYCLNHMPES